MIDPYEIDESEVQQLADELSDFVVQRGLEAPAILFLEMNKPLGFIASQSLVVTSPLLAPLFGLEKIGRFSKLLSSREHIEKLITKIEEKSAQRKEPLKQE